MGKRSGDVKRCAARVAAAIFLLVTSAASAAPLTVGNLIILRTGTGAGSLSNAATAVFLDEYTPAGTLVQSIAMPTSGASAFTLSGTQASEGILNRSQDGTLITFAGYRKNAGLTNPNADPSTTHRVIATLDPSGAVTTSLAVNDASGVASSVATVDGSKFYLASSAGMRYVNGSSGTLASTILNGRNSRQAILSADDRLIVGNAATTVSAKIDDYGVLPTGVVNPPAMLVSLALNSAVHGLFLADLNPAVPGDDTMYFINEGFNELRKFTFDGSAWTGKGTISSGVARNITGVVDGTDVTLYITSPTGLFTLTDTTGTGTMTATTLGTAVFTAPANTNFRGVVVVPEPAGIALALSLAAALFRRPRRAALP